MRDARFLGILGILLIALFCAGSALAQTSASPAAGGAPVQPTMKIGQNGMNTSFAWIDTDARPDYEGPATPVEVRMTIKNASGVAKCHVVMFGFNSLNEKLEVEFDGLRADDIPLSIHQDNRSSKQQPKLWVKADQIPFDQEIVMDGSVSVRANGQFHVGAIVIAFDPQYRKCVTPANEYAEVYAYGLMGATDVPGRPLEGQGNVPSIGLLAILGAAAVALGLRRRV